MRIAYDNQVFCNQSYGGISRYFVRLAEQLSSANIQIRIFASLHQNHYLAQLPTSIVFGHILSSYPPRGGRIIRKFNDALSKNAIKYWMPDLVHETYYAKVGSAPKGCPTVITVYDMIHELFPESFSPFDNTSEIKRIAIERADHIICISESTRQDLIRYFNTSLQKITVVHLGVDKYSIAKLTEKQSITIKKPYLLYVGNRKGYKNFSYLLRALSSSCKLKNDFDLLAFGGGQFDQMELMLLSELGYNQNQVQHIDGDDQLLGKLYKEATAFVYPSLYEGFGLPPLEAMAHDCPVISSNISSMPEVIGDAAEYFNPTSIENIKQAIENVVYSPSRMEELIRQGNIRLKNFSWKRCTEETLAVYSQFTK